MLARDPCSHLSPVVDEHVLVMAEHDVELHLERRLGYAQPALEPLDDLTDEPGPSVASATDHQTVGARLGQCLIGVVEGEDVAVGDDGNADCILNFADEFPIGGSGIKLAASAA